LVGVHQSTFYFQGYIEPDAVPVYPHTLGYGGAELIASKSPMTESLIEIQSIPKLKRSISVF